MSRPTEIDPDDLPLLSPSADCSENPGEICGDELLDQSHNGQLTENMAYAPDRKFNYSSPVSEFNTDITPPVSELDREAEEMSIIHDDEEVPEAPEVLNTDDEGDFVPSEVSEYYTEAAMSTKQRKALPDDIFGLPRTRQYPLNDRKHVLQAIRMFRHCKDPEDRKTLTKNIVAAMKKFEMQVDIGENNPMYEYLPAPMQEAAIPGSMLMTMTQDALGLEKKRTRDDVIRDHIGYNAQFYNNVFYNTEYAKSIIMMEGISFFDYFYPNVITHNFYVRMKTALGGLGMDASIYKNLHIRKPLETDFTRPLGWCSPNDAEDLPIAIELGYNVQNNWFKVDLSNDIDHIFYCIRLYSVLGEILNNPRFSESTLTDKHHALIADWYQKVSYHYGLMKDEKEYTSAWYKEIQYLHDLLWSFLDNPYSDDDKARCIATFASSMACSGGSTVTQSDHSLVTKADCVKYLISTLGMDDDIFLLPDVMEYPVLNKESVKLAMDSIRLIEKEQPDRVQDFAKRLNQKYAELGCSFSITPDHPYAKYASKNIVNNMIFILSEGDTVVSDNGTSVASTGVSVDQPWYKRLDYIDAMHRDGLENKELGPNTKPMQKPDYAQTDSFM